MGSSHNQTKLGDPDEFDYVFQLELMDLLQGRGRFERIDGKALFNEIVLKMAGDVDMVTYQPGPDKVTILDSNKVSSLLGDIILKVLSELKLPPGWQHGGINRPSFSGIRLKGPSFVLQFDYLNTSDQVPLCLSIDFVPMVQIPFSTDKALNVFLKSVTELQYCWVPINDSRRISYGHAEEMLLSLYSPESTAKKLMRISKALRIVLQMCLTAYPFKSDLIELLTTKKGICTRDIDTYINSSLRKDDYVTCSDLGESGADSYMVKSYWIKHAVLEMMSKDGSHGRGWTDDDLPELVIRVYLRVLVTVLAEFRTGNPVKQMFSISLEDEYKTTTPKCAPHTRMTALHLKRPITMVFELFTGKLRKLRDKNPANINDQLCVLSRAAGLLQLFRCVCEGKREVELVIYDINLKPLVSKKEFEEIKKKYLKND